MSSEQCAQNPDSSLKDPKDIQPPTDTWTAVAHEQLDSNQESDAFIQLSKRKRAAQALNISSSAAHPLSLASSNPFKVLPVEEPSDDEDDGSFKSDCGSESGDNSSDGSTLELAQISNDKLADILLRKMVVDLSRGSRKQLCKMGACKCKITKAQFGPSTLTSKHAHAMTNETPNEGVSTPGGLSCDSSLMSIKSLAQKPAGKQNPIYHFYESISMNSHREVGNPGDRHYKCHHGTHKVITVTHAMKHNVNGLVGHLKGNFQAMYRLYIILKDRTKPSTPDDLAIASTTKVLDVEATNAYLG
ncbi:hypothetical protein HD554DRAFT_2170888 [Boletus coccyginus]|nr:hypothetical protein HD554DRAFT_2170888 [Boletus coccyginus]